MWTQFEVCSFVEPAITKGKDKWSVLRLCVVIVLMWRNSYEFCPKFSGNTSVSSDKLTSMSRGWNCCKTENGVRIWSEIPLVYPQILLFRVLQWEAQLLKAKYSFIMAAASRKNQFKVVLLGEGCVGKTSLMLRYVQDKFNEKHLTTLQVSCCHFLLAIRRLRYTVRTLYRDLDNTYNKT